MRTRITLLLSAILIGFNLTQAQVDSHGNPVFNSIELNEEDMGAYSITSSYYTIANNIDNKESSVYMSDHPTAAEYFAFATAMPSYFFIVHQDIYIVASIILMLDTSTTGAFHSYYQIVIPGENGILSMPEVIWGEISKHRAEELIALGIDSNARIIDLPNNGKGLLLDGIVYGIQPYEEVYEEVKRLAKWLVKCQEDNLEFLIKNRSAEGHDLDFDKALEKDPQLFYLYESVAYNRKDYAILLWGRAVARLGMKSSKKVCKLWEEIYGRELTDPEIKALKKGFEG